MSSEEKFHEYEVLIRETHLDTFGHVNNAVYLSLFEEARWDIVTKRGYGLKEVHRDKLGPTILEVNVKFRREIRNRETIRIRTSVVSQQGKITTLRQVMINSAGEAACIADFVVGLFDMNTRKLVEPTPEWKRALDL